MRCENFSKFLSEAFSAMGGGRSDEVIVTGIFADGCRQLAANAASAPTMRTPLIRFFDRVVILYLISWLGGTGSRAIGLVWQ